MKKRHFTSPFVVASALLAVVASASGCKIESKQDREARQDQKQEEREAKQEQKQEERDAQKSVSSKLKTLSEEDAKVEIAKRDLSDRIAAYEAIAGSHDGYYRNAENKRYAVKLTLVVNNLPLAAEPNRPLKEADVLAQIQALSLDVLVEEFWNSSNPNDRVISCNISNIKPDLATGILRFSCNAGGQNGLARQYIVGLDTLENGFETTFDSTTLEQRSKRTADDLVLKKSNRIDAMNLKIVTPSFDFQGKLKRKGQ